MVYIPCVCHTCALRASCTHHHACITHATTHVQERFNSMHPAYYHLAHACILCFDVTRKQTYKNLPDWHSELVGDGAYPRGRHHPSSPPDVTEGAGRTYAPTAERSLGCSVASGGAARSLSLERPQAAALQSLERRRPPASRDAALPLRACRYRELREFRQGIPVVCIGNKIDVDPKVTHLLDLLAHVRTLTCYTIDQKVKPKELGSRPRTSSYTPLPPVPPLAHPYTPLHSPTQPYAPLAPLTPLTPLTSPCR